MPRRRLLNGNTSRQRNQPSKVQKLHHRHDPQPKSRKKEKPSIEIDIAFEKGTELSRIID